MRLKPHSDGCLGKTQRVRNGNVLRITWLYVLILLPLPYAFADYLDSYHLLSDFCSTFGLAVIFNLRDVSFKPIIGNVYETIIYFQFKELMNKIDREEEEDLNQTNGPGGDITIPIQNPIPTTPAKNPRINSVTPSKSANKRSSNRDDDSFVPGAGKQQQQPYVRYPVSQSKEQPRSRSTRAAAVAATAAVSGTTNYSGGNMVLDPATGEMVPAGSDGEEDFDDEDGYEDEDDVQVLGSKPKPVLINLGQSQLKSSSSSSKNSLQVCVCVFCLSISLNGCKEVGGSSYFCTIKLS